MTVLDLLSYYAGLLILEYVGLPNANAFIQTLVLPALLGQLENTVQTLTFSGIAASGTFTLTFGSPTQETVTCPLSTNGLPPAQGTFQLVYSAVDSLSISWNATMVQIQNAIQAVPALSMATVSQAVYYANGGIAAFVVTFNGVSGDASMMTVTADPTFQDSSGTAIVPTVAVTVTGPLTTAAIAWNAPLSTIESDLDGILGANQVVSITGSLASGSLVIVLNNSQNMPLLTAASSLLTSGSSAVLISISGNEDLGPLPLQIQNAFDINTASGVQLDVLGKYAGVTRGGYGLYGPITLIDSDFQQLMKLAIVTNSSGSDLNTIQNFLNLYFPGEMFVFDYQNMRMAYAINSSIGSQNLVQMFVSEGLLPRPMGVQLSSVIYGSSLNGYFGCRTYDAPLFNVVGYNTYDSYSLTKPMLTYDDALQT